MGGRWNGAEGAFQLAGEMWGNRGESTSESRLLGGGVVGSLAGF